MRGEGEDASSGPGGLLACWEDEPRDVWRGRWGVPALEVWGRLGSTNDRLKELAEEGALPFTVVVAEEQTEGRGRGGRRWQSPPGVGLWMSVLLAVPDPSARRLVPLVVGLAACRAVERVAGVDARLKWPNDLWVEGRKAAGILCESVGEHGVVAGVGVNVAQRMEDFPAELRERAVSLAVAARRPVARPVLAGELVSDLEALLRRPPTRLDGRLGDELAARDALLGREVRVEGGPRGTAAGIDAEGRLVVQGPGGRLRAVVAGTVTVVSGDRRVP